MLKVSGEVLGGKQGFSLDRNRVEEICQEIKTLKEKGNEVAIVVGGGNFWRGRDTEDSGIIERDRHLLGMTATVFNGVMLKATLEKLAVQSTVYSAIPTFNELAEPWNPERGLQDIKEHKIVICVGGTGKPFFSTDSGAAARAVDLQCDLILKATNVDGVYDKDPNKHDDAVKYNQVSFDEVIEKKLKVMDQEAFEMCREHNISIRVFNIETPGNIASALDTDDLGTLIS